MNVVNQADDRFALPKGREIGNSVFNVDYNIDASATAEKQKGSTQILRVVAADACTSVRVRAGWAAMKEFDMVTALGES